MSVLGRLKSLFGFNEEDTSEISSFTNAGMTTDEDPPKSTGAEAMAAIATNAEPGTYTDPNVINAQNVAGNALIGNAPVSTTGLTNDGTTGTTTGNIVGTQIGGGTQPPPFATPGIVGGGMGSPLVNVLNNQVVETVNEKGQKSKSMQDLIEIGGTGFDDEVLARKLRRQAAMPDLKNEDYYPNQPFTQAQTAWGDPIFSGAGALFPMAAYDAQIRARAQAEIDEAKRNVMQVKIPEVKTAAYYQKVRSDFTNEIMGATNEAVKRFGGNNQKAMQYLRQSGILDQIENKYNALAMNIDQFADEANAFLKGARENPDKIYSSLEGVKAANNFLAGMNAFNNGEITAEQLNGLRETFQTAERWSNYKKDALEKYADDEVSPGIMGDNLTPEEEAIFQRQLNLPDGFKDKRHFLVVKKYSEANEGKIKEAIVKPFFNENRTALEQLRVGNETEDQTIDRVSKELAALRGTKIYEDIISESESKGNTTIVNLPGGTTTEEPYYERINAKRDEIVNNTKQALDKINKANQQGQQKVGALQGAVKNIFRGISDQGEVTKDYIGFEPVNVKPYNFKVQPTLLGEYMIFDEKTKSFRNSTPTDFPGLDANNFGTTATGGSLSGQEIVLMTPDGKLVPWDSKDIPAGSELFVKQKITIDYMPKSGFEAPIPAKSATVYSIGPITQNFKVADQTFQKRTEEESTKGAGQPFQFGQPK